jgi:hypothetical protein
LHFSATLVQPFILTQPTKELITNQLLLSLQNLHEILLHVDVDRAVAGKRAASFDVAGEG